MRRIDTGRAHAPIWRIAGDFVASARILTQTSIMLRARFAPALLVLGLGVVVSGGCASSANHAKQATVAPAPKPEPPRASPVMPGEDIVRYQASAGGTLPFERFEFARNNGLLNVVREVPIQASRQWPEPPRPRERPVIFLRWRQ